MKCSQFVRFSIIFSFIALSACSVKKSPQIFLTPDNALKSLEEAVASRSVQMAENLFGSEGDYILHRGDPVADKERGQKFVKLFEEKHELYKNEDGSYTLILGKKNWPFPVPLVSGEKGWFFDAEAGREEILTTTIGANELRAIEVSRDVYLSQRIYAASDWDSDGTFKYADRIISTPGKKDGLYWPAAEGESVSPFGPTIAEAADENYTVSPDGEPKPYRGYLYKLLPKTEKAEISDALTRPGQYWLVATPAEWGVSGVMTFATNERGWIYEKNLTENVQLSKVQIGIDETWNRIE